MGVDDVISVYKEVGSTAQTQPANDNKPDANPNRRCGDRHGRRRPRRRGPEFPAVCVTCGKETEVPFEPTAERPAYCKECYRNVKSASRTTPEPKQPVARQPEPEPASETPTTAPEVTALVVPPPALSEGRPEDLGDNLMNADRGWDPDEKPQDEGKRAVAGEFAATPLLRRQDSDDRKSGAPSEHSLRGTNPRRYTSK